MTVMNIALYSFTGRTQAENELSDETTLRGWLKNHVPETGEDDSRERQWRDLNYVAVPADERDAKAAEVAAALGPAADGFVTAASWPFVCLDVVQEYGFSIERHCISSLAGLQSHIPRLPAES